MSAASVPLMSTLSMSKTVVKSSLHKQSKRKGGRKSQSREGSAVSVPQPLPVFPKGRKVASPMQPIHIFPTQGQMKQGLLQGLNLSNLQQSAAHVQRKRPPIAQHAQEAATPSRTIPQQQSVGDCYGRDSEEVAARLLLSLNTHLLDCMSTVPLLMMSRRRTAHSVVCWVLRCTVSNMPPTWQEGKKRQQLERKHLGPA